MARGSCVLAAVLSVSSLTVAPAAADVVTDWNAIAGRAVVAAGAARPGPSGLIDWAMVQLAVHDAMQAYQHRFDSYGAPIANAQGSHIAAVATAAHDVLIGVGFVNLTAPVGTIESEYQSYLSTRGLTNDDGIQVGHDAATNILNLRVNNDGRIPANAEQFFGGTNPGDWRPTVFVNGQPQPMVATYIGRILPFTLHDPTQFRQEPPPNLKSGKYAEEYDEVKSLGSLNGSGRTGAQTDMALFFADNAVQYWNRTMRGIVVDQQMADSGDIAHMFALVEMAMADSLIVAWNSKRFFNFWRPITAIRLGDTDGNPRTVGDPGWTPFIVTPNYPEYVSGANSLSGAATNMLANFFGTDHVAFSMTSTFVHPNGAVPQNPRLYDRFSAAADDIVDARIYEGIHFRSADEDARSQGKHVANWVFNHFLGPVH